ncbi:MAG: NADP(H)-dependent aldo-keto reductase [Cyclobacteriaceae bacterium]
MKYNKLGNSSLSVSHVCLGTMTFGEQNSESEGHEQLDYAVDQGINFIDTAEMYSVPSKKETVGSTERIIGTWLKKRSDRDQLIIASKIAGPNPNLSHIRETLDFTPQSIDIALDGSLDRLQTDYLDIYQLHWPERKVNCFGVLDYPYRSDNGWEDNFLEVIQKLSDLIKEGKIRNWGLSNESAWGAMRVIHLAEMHGLSRPISIQNPYCLLNRSYEIGLSEISLRENMPLLAYSPLGFGVLSGKYHKGGVPKNSRLDLFPRFARYSNEVAMKATEKYIAIAKNAGLTCTELSLAYVYNRPFVGSTIIGATSMEQLKENVSAHKVVLSNDVLAEIDAVHKEISNPAP